MPSHQQLMFHRMVRLDDVTRWLESGISCNFHPKNCKIPDKDVVILIHFGPFPFAKIIGITFCYIVGSRVICIHLLVRCCFLGPIKEWVGMLNLDVLEWDALLKRTTLPPAALYNSRDWFRWAWWISTDFLFQIYSFHLLQQTLH